MTMRHAPLTSCLALGLTLLSASLAPTAAAPKPSAVVVGWQKRLDAADTALRAGQFKQARNLSRRVLDEMCELILDGEDTDNALGLALTFLALGEAGAGEEDAARWHWHTAQQIFPAAGRFDLTPYGAMGQWLKAQELRTFAKLPQASMEEPTYLLGGEIQPPKKKSAPLPEYPDAMRQDRRELLVVVSVVIDQQGKVSNPQVLNSSGAPTMVLATFEALRRWKFRPALLNGQPVKVFYTLTVNFKLQ